MPADLLVEWAEAFERTPKLGISIGQLILRADEASVMIDVGPSEDEDEKAWADRLEIMIQILIDAIDQVEDRMPDLTK